MDRNRLPDAGHDLLRRRDRPRPSQSRAGLTVVVILSVVATACGGARAVTQVADNVFRYSDDALRATPVEVFRPTVNVFELTGDQAARVPAVLGRATSVLDAADTPEASTVRESAFFNGLGQLLDDHGEQIEDYMCEAYDWLSTAAESPTPAALRIHLRNRFHNAPDLSLDEVASLVTDEGNDADALAGLAIWVACFSPDG